MPRALARAGFTVTLLTPRDSLAEKSGFVSRVGHMPDGATARQWLYAFGAAVKASSPRLVVPGDDIALRLLQSTSSRCPGPAARPAARLDALVAIPRRPADTGRQRSSRFPMPRRHWVSEWRRSSSPISPRPMFARASAIR
jgi:hypothetical protein